MAVNFSDAVQAYDQALRTGAKSGMEPRDRGSSSDFSAVLKEATSSVVDDLRASETQTIKAVAGTANLDDVVLAVSQAEMTLTTVVSIRDKVVQAYQEILRMPV